MSKPDRLPNISISHAYFITSTTAQRKRLFQSPAIAELFIETLLHYRNEGKYRLHAFVVMPDHFHALISPLPGTTLERAVQFIKGGSSFRMKSELGRNSDIWQRGFTDRRVRSEEEFESFVTYIHENPVKAGIVNGAAEYSYSSANPAFIMDASGRTSAAKAGQ